MLRGVGRSGGEWDYGSFRQAGRDGHDLVEWFAAQPFSDGRIGMYGESFGGQTSYSTAVERPEHLVAIAPMQSPSSLYHDVVFPGGIKSTERGDIDNWPDIANLTSGGVVDADAEFAANRAHPTFDGFWRDRSFVDCLDSVAIPVLAIGGWNDHYFRSGTLANIEALPGATWAVYGPWAHYFPVALNQEPSGRRSTAVSGSRSWARRPRCPPVCCWPGSTTGWRACPMCRSHRRRRSRRSKGPAGIGAGWRELDRWDPDGATATSLRLGADGSLGASGRRRNRDASVSRMRPTVGSTR